MKLELNQIGACSSSPASIIEFKIEGGNTNFITEVITNNEMMVYYDFIQSLKDIIDKLEEHNQRVANQTEF